ncbi:Calcium-binding EF-hand [Corchorus capsularis]|uniref:Calcium-binding EF-hand n=1 Tax=Corchorus capsularis TaxID=210143 RepID=A0A1R3HFC4_COCAP|nr:Calcium-binding EF-hand [Corchorus capsularis]
MAYYAHLPQSRKDEAIEYFESLDIDGDGEIDVNEFMGWVKQRGLITSMRDDSFISLFKALDKDKNGSLDYGEFLTFFYLMESGRIMEFCGGCGAFLKGVFFTCLECFNSGIASSDVCCSCYRNNNFKHHHYDATFVDSHALLLAIWRQKHRSASASEPPRSHPPGTRQVEIIDGQERLR